MPLLLSVEVYLAHDDIHQKLGLRFCQRIQFQDYVPIQPLGDRLAYIGVKHFTYPAIA